MTTDGPEERYPNSPYAEQGITAGEQQKITEIRLEKLNVEIKADGASADASSRRVNALGGEIRASEKINFMRTTHSSGFCFSFIRIALKSLPVMHVHAYT